MHGESGIFSFPVMLQVTPHIDLSVSRTVLTHFDAIN